MVGRDWMDLSLSDGAGVKSSEVNWIEFGMISTLFDYSTAIVSRLCEQRPALQAISRCMLLDF